MPDPPPARRASRARADDDLGAAGEPVAEDDLLALRLAHRLARHDTRALAAVADGLATGREHVDDRRAAAFGDWVERVCDEFAAHVAAEEEVVRPLARRYGARTAERGTPDALLAEVRRGARSVVNALLVRPAAVATAGDFTRMRELATRLADLADHVDAHLAESERIDVSAVVARVPRAAWVALEGDEHRPWPAWSRLLAVATPAETAAWRARHGWPTATAARLRGACLRRRARRVYGRHETAD